MIPYIGCISREDADVLEMLVRTSPRILEFGAGASTQIFAAYSPTGDIHTVETDPEWIAKTAGNLHRLGLNTDRTITWHDWSGFEPAGEYDLIFVDGADDLRLEFAMMTWPYLRVGGTMAFHDTRRTEPHGLAKFSDVQNVCQTIAKYSTEIYRVDFNAHDSNTTLVVKRTPLLYENWQIAEGRTDAQMGLD